VALQKTSHSLTYIAAANPIGLRLNFNSFHL